MAALHAEMLNQAFDTALVDAVRVTWNNAPITLNPLDFVDLDTDFGLEIRVIGLDAITSPAGLTLQPAGAGAVPAPGSTHIVEIVLYWDGTVPTPHQTLSGAPYRPGVAADEDDLIFRRAGTLVIEFDYGPTP
jgi:hypothetical protein